MTARAWRTAHSNSSTLEGGYSCLESRPPNMLNGVHIWTPSSPIHDLHTLLWPKNRHVMCWVGRGIVLDIHNISPKNARPTGKHTITENLMLHWQLRVPSVTTMSSTSFLLSLWWLAPNTMTEGLWLLSVGLMHAFVSLFPCLRLTQVRPSLWNSMKRDLPLKTHCEDTVPPVTDVPHSARSPSHTVASPVIQSQSKKPWGSHSPIASSQKPVYNAPNWQPPPKCANHLHA